MSETIRELISEEDVAAKVKEIGAQITKDYEGKAVHLICVLKGGRLEASWGEDPSRVVVDEMVGVWIALLAAPAGHVWYALGAFVLFRLFDIFKPLGIRRMESLPGGIGVMMDDILSGVYGFIILIVARWIIS